MSPFCEKNIFLTYNFKTPESSIFFVIIDSKSDLLKQNLANITLGIFDLLGFCLIRKVDSNSSKDQGLSI